MSRRLEWKRVSRYARELDAARWVQDEIDYGRISSRACWVAVALIALAVLVRL